MENLKIASLFCGCGGTDLGLEGGFSFLNKYYDKNPVEIVYANDIEKSACDTFNANFVVQCDKRDIRMVDADTIPDHDILTGGFPCQSFSVSAQNPKRLGYKDERGKLFFEMCRVLKAKQPLCFIAENVKGLLSANKRMAFPLILEEFKKCGYRVQYGVFNAAYYGVPQRRERIFIVGFRNDLSVDFSLQQAICDNDQLVPLSSVLFSEEEIPAKYYFSERALAGLERANPHMNKGRGQDLNKPCNTVGAHLAKVSLNSTDPVLKVENGYRRFTPREVARIQSFPDTFQLVGSEAGQYKALGNAIPPVLMWHIAQDVIKAVQNAVFYPELFSQRSLG